MTVVEGVGVHSGARVRVRLHRDDGPLSFRLGRTRVPADVEHVVDTPRCTVLGADGASVAMVEHLLAALTTRGFWRGVTIEVDGPEMPILDGSAVPWIEAVDGLGTPPPRPAPLEVIATVERRLGDALVRAEPGPQHLDVRVRFDHPAIGAQRWTGGPERFTELLAARTFVTYQELVDLQARGLALGAERGRGIVFTTHGPEPELHWPDEPVRHKALDAIGDLALLGRPLGACLTIERGSHAAHVAFMRHVRTHSHEPPADDRAALDKRAPEEPPPA